MKGTGRTIGGSVHSIPVALAKSVALTTPGFGGCAYSPTGRGFIVFQVIPKPSPPSSK